MTVEDIPGPETARDGVYKGSVLPTMNKKLIANSLNILFDKLGDCKDKTLVTEVSAYLMLAVYKMFRLLYSAQPKNTASLFSLTPGRWQGYTDAAMSVAQANAEGVLSGEDTRDKGALQESLAMTSESLSRDYPLYATSLLNLIKTSEARAERQK